MRYAIVRLCRTRPHTTTQYEAVDERMQPSVRSERSGRFLPTISGVTLITAAISIGCTIGLVLGIGTVPEDNSSQAPSCPRSTLADDEKANSASPSTDPADDPLPARA